MKTEHPLAEWINIEGIRVLKMFWSGRLMTYCLPEYDPDALDKERCAELVGDYVERARKYGIDMERADIRSRSYMEAVSDVLETEDQLREKWASKSLHERGPWNAYKEEKYRVYDAFIESRK
ncbi:hypothetical protein [Arhodomonas sp. AD133]|uniref:hypothetical protein n=1 Tax=Arhodomonas sp. AD133 TaxID=3415009 RepID=UPI003EBEC654